MTNNLLEAKKDVLEYIIGLADDDYQDGLNYPDENGVCGSYEDAFDNNRSEVIKDSYRWMEDYGLTYDEKEQLENWLWTIHAYTCDMILDTLTAQLKKAA